MRTVFRSKLLSRTFNVLRSRKGFTLLELVISMSIMVLAIAVIFYAYVQVMTIFSSEVDESDSSFQAHKAVERMVSELRNSPQLVTLSSREVMFWYQDTNGNSTRESNETVDYIWLPTTEVIYRTQGNTTETAANYILNMTLSKDADNNMVTINVTAQRTTSVVTLESSAKSRNL